MPVSSAERPRGWFVVIVGLVAGTGCYASHQRAIDRDAASPEAREDGGVPRDVHVDGPELDAWDPPSCGPPVEGWALLEERYEGDWSAICSARADGVTWLVGRPTERARPLVLVRFDDSAPPVRLADMPLFGTERSRCIDAATDGSVVATLTPDLAGGAVLFIHELSGSLLSTAHVDLPRAARVSLAIRSPYVGIVWEEWPEGVFAEVRAVTGGAPLVAETLSHHTRPGIGLGPRRFSFVATFSESGRGSRMYLLDEEGIVPDLTFDSQLNFPTYDGMALAGTAAPRGLLVRNRDGRIEHRHGPPRPRGGDGFHLDVADSPHGVIVATSGDDAAYISTDTASGWVALPAPDQQPHADANPRRVGAFFLVPRSGLLTWAGYGCD